MKKEPVIVLSSGGFDSNILIAEMAKKYSVVYPVYIRSGYFWEKAEIYWLKKYLKALKNKKIKPLTILSSPTNDIDKQGWAITGKKTPGYASKDEEVYLPGRNLLLLSKSAVFATSKKISKIAIGSLAGNPFADATPRFFRTLEKSASLALDFPIKILTPFIRLKKMEVIDLGKNLPIRFSFSCLSPRQMRPCKKCNKCAEKNQSLLKPAISNKNCQSS